MLFKNQQKIADEDLLGYAKELGLDVDKVKLAIKDHKYQAGMQADQDLADDIQASGTPHFFINGRRLVGAQPVEKFKAVIDEEMTKAQALVGKGIKAKDVYAEIIKDGKEPPPPEKKTVDAPAANSPWKGGKDAKVTMQVFSDFQCPSASASRTRSSRSTPPTATRSRSSGATSPSRCTRTLLASEAAQEAYAQKGNAGFWKMHDLLFEKQGSGPEVLQRAALESYAETQGLDMTKFKKALDANTHKAFVDSESAVADKAGISGTPAFVINGYFISGAQPFGKFKKIIDKALAEAGVKK